MVCFKSKCEYFLNMLKQNRDYIFRKDDKYYYVSNVLCIVGSKEEIEEYSWK